MSDYTEQEIQEALDKIETMDHYEMCRLWRFAPAGNEIYFQTITPVAEAFRSKLFDHYGGFTSKISKALGWNE